jgi:hypothetical protein
VLWTLGGKSDDFNLPRSARLGFQHDAQPAIAQRELTRGEHLAVGRVVAAQRDLVVAHDHGVGLVVGPARDQAGLGRRLEPDLRLDAHVVHLEAAQHDRVAEVFHERLVGVYRPVRRGADTDDHGVPGARPAPLVANVPPSPGPALR